MEHHYRTVVEPALLRHSSPSPSSCAAPSLFTQLQRVPKTDFHCHLNGSITPALLAHMERLVLHERRRHQATDAAAGDDDDDAVEHAEELANPTEEESDLLFFNTQEKRMQNVLASPTGNEPAAAVPGSSSTRSTPKDRMNYCFTVFDAIYKIMTNLAFTRLAVQDMLVCSAAENIFVMEVRTSLRDGLMRTFRTSAAKRMKEEGEEAVLKQTYVDAVVETVEHLLSGGLVDFMTGELLPLDTSAAILAAHSNSTNSAAGDADGAAAAARRWWAVYDRVYGSLLLPESPPTPPPQQEQEEGKKEHETSPSSLYPCDEEANQKQQQQLHQEEKKNASRLFFVQRVSFNLTHRMHVRLLLSVNRAAPESAAWEAARLTTDTQQLQVRAFHAWCRRCSSGRVDAPTAADVLAKLRRTCWVTGMDLSGNCYRGLYTTFNAALAAARCGSASSATATRRSELQGQAAWLRTTAAITLHGGEKVDEEELSAMVAFEPERWGHLVFTDDVNLSTILAAQQGIELCLTSNLLTSGHADVAEHHLGHLLELWDSMKESRVVSAEGEGEEEEEEKAPGECEGGGSRSDAPAALLRRGGLTATASATYRATEQARLARRLLCATRRWEYADAPFYSSSSSPPSSSRGLALPPPPHAQAGGVALLPNVSFHTDDRGVFGTTLTDELLLASQHTGVGRMAALLTETEKKAKTTTTSTLTTTSGVAAAAAEAAGTEALWMLERLSLLQIFELPMPVQLLAVLLTEKMSGDDKNNGRGAASDKEEEERSARCECGRAVLTQWEHITAQTPSTWGDWDSFAAVCEQVLSHKPSAGGRGVPELLSAWEVAWLTEEFDRYW